MPLYTYDKIGGFQKTRPAFDTFQRSIDRETLDSDELANDKARREEADYSKQKDILSKHLSNGVTDFDTAAQELQANGYFDAAKNVLEEKKRREDKVKLKQFQDSIPELGSGATPDQTVTQSQDVPLERFKNPSTVLYNGVEREQQDVDVNIPGNPGYGTGFDPEALAYHRMIKSGLISEPADLVKAAALLKPPKPATLSETEKANEITGAHPELYNWIADNTKKGLPPSNDKILQQAFKLGGVPLRNAYQFLNKSPDLALPQQQLGVSQAHLGLSQQEFENTKDQQIQNRASKLADNLSTIIPVRQALDDMVNEYKRLGYNKLQMTIPSGVLKYPTELAQAADRKNFDRYALFRNASNRLQAMDIHDFSGAAFSQKELAASVARIGQSILGDEATFLAAVKELQDKLTANEQSAKAGSGAEGVKRYSDSLGNLQKDDKETKDKIKPTDKPKDLKNNKTKRIKLDKNGNEIP